MGDWTIYFLLVTLAITPARRLFDWSKLILIRRIVGLTALAYILVHLGLYIVDSRLDLGFVAREIVLRIYLTIGFAAILGLVALGVTSTDGMIRRMGGKAWNRLHALIYVIAPLAILHYYLQSKIDVTQPVLMSGFYFWLMGYRLMARCGYKQGAIPLVLLTVAAALLTALTEADLVRACHRRRLAAGDPRQSRLQLHDPARLVGACRRPGGDAGLRDPPSDGPPPAAPPPQDDLRRRREIPRCRNRTVPAERHFALPAWSAAGLSRLTTRPRYPISGGRIPEGRRRAQWNSPPDGSDGQGSRSPLSALAPPHSPVTWPR